MRVLAVGNMYPPHHLGGYELVFRSAMGHLRSLGNEVRVLTTDFRTATTEPDDPDTYRDLRWYWHDHQWPRIGWRERIALERHNHAVLERHLEELRPDVVSWWAMGGMSLSMIERITRSGVPAVAFVHDDWLIYSPKVDRWTRAFRRSSRLAALAEAITGLPASVDLEGAARFVFVSETVRAHARAAGYKLTGSTVAHSGIEQDYLDPAPEQPWRWRLLYVGRIDERKGVGDAVASLAELPDDATLTIAGDGDPRARESLQERASSLNLGGRLQVLGMRPRAQLPEIYTSCDAVVFPVRWEEPWGLVPLEAMALGRPVIATGRGGSGEYLHDEVNCLLVPVGDPAAIAQAFRRLQASPDLRSRLRAAGMEAAGRHTETAFNEAAAQILLEVARSRR